MIDLFTDKLSLSILSEYQVQFYKTIFLSICLHQNITVPFILICPILLDGSKPIAKGAVPTEIPPPKINNHHCLNAFKYISSALVPLPPPWKLSRPPSVPFQATGLDVIRDQAKLSTSLWNFQMWKANSV